MRLLTALLVAILAVSLPACGQEEDDRPRELYGVYRSTDQSRDVAEGRLRQALSDLASAAGRRDRVGALAAIDRGRVAAAEIDRLLGKEIAAVAGIRRYAKFSGDASRLEHGLRTSREGVRLFARELAIGARDPFLDVNANAREVRRLARVGGQLSVDGEAEVRRASRDLARALGVEPPFDPLLEREESATGP